jgi:hypothetical protein
MTATTEELKAAFDHFAAAVERKRQAALVKRAQPYRARGWNDLAEVIENETGKQIVRNGLSDVLDWLGQ